MRPGNPWETCGSRIYIIEVHAYTGSGCVDLFGPDWQVEPPEKDFKPEGETGTVGTIKEKDSLSPLKPHCHCFALFKMNQLALLWTEP